MRKFTLLILLIVASLLQINATNNPMQRVYFSYQDDDKTYDLNINGLIPSREGRYLGFGFGTTSGTNTLPFSGGLVLGQWNGLAYPTEADVSVLTNKTGFWKTRQGAMVAEDGNITLPITANATANGRIDLVIGSHQYTAVSGGSAATYSIVAGTPSATPVAPAIPNPKTDVIIGTLFVPAGTGVGITTLAKANYTPARIPNFANDDSIPHVDWLNVFTKLNLFRGFAGEIGNAKLTTTGTPNEYYIDLTNGGVEDGMANFYILDMPGMITTEFYKTVIIMPDVMNGARIVQFYPSMNIRISSGFNLETSGGKDVFIKAHTPFQMVRWGFGGLNKWQLIVGEQSSKIVPSKHLAIIMENIEYSADISVAGAIDRVGNGNTINIATAASTTAKWIKSLDETVDGATYASESGTRISIIANTGVPLIFETQLHVSAGQPAAPTGYKRILNPNGYDIKIENKGVINLVETADYWVVTSVNGEVPNWKPITAPTTTSFGYVARVGATLAFKGYIMLHNNGDPAIGGNSGNTFFTLPQDIAENGKRTYAVDTFFPIRLPLKNGATGLGTTEYIEFEMSALSEFKGIYHAAFGSGHTIWLYLNELRLSTAW